MVEEEEEAHPEAPKFLSSPIDYPESILLEDPKKPWSPKTSFPEKASITKRESV